MTARKKKIAKPARDLTVIKLPFQGFYESWYSGELDHEESQYAEHLAEKEGETYPPELRLDASTFSELLFEHMNYRSAELEIAEEYVDSFDRMFSDELELPLRLKYESMDSPREYNFTTDRVYAHIPLAVVRKLFRKSERFDNHATLAQVIAERFTSYSGFISGYRNDLESWLSKPLRDWDHNELETLLLANIRQVYPEGKRGACRSDWEYTLFDHVTDDGFYCQVLDRHVDWAKFDMDCAERRADKEAELRADDPDYVPPALRCRFTLDLFEKR